MLGPSNWSTIPLSHFVLAIALLLTATLLVSSFYQLFLHPLSKYPGPFLGRITQLYDLYHSYIGDEHILLYKLHQKYGTYVRYSPNNISINDPAALKAIYAHGANVQKSEFYRCFRAAPDAISALLATDKAQSARKRRIVGPAFSDQAIRELEEYVQSHVEDLVERLRTTVEQPGLEKHRWSATVNMQEWCNWFVFDVMGDLVFGKSFGTLGEKPENREGIRLLGRAARRNYTVAAMPLLVNSGLEKYLPFLRGLFLDREKYLAFGKRQVLERMEDQEKTGGETGRKDIFSFLLHAKDPENGEGLPMNELWMEGNTLIVAGSDTSSTTLSATLYYILSNPEAQRRLEEEVRSIFTSAQEIRSGDQLQSCTWLRCCIDESMRMTPAVASVLPREVLPGGFNISDLELHLPEGVIVGSPTYALQHHAAFVNQPFKYDPGRWLRESERESLQEVFCPFSHGARACLGKPLVYMENSIAIARLFWEFDMRLAPEQALTPSVLPSRRKTREYVTRDWFLGSGAGPLVQFKVRAHDKEDDSFSVADCD